MSLKNRLQAVVRRALGIDFDPEEMSSLRGQMEQIAATLATVGAHLEQMNEVFDVWRAERMDEFVAYRAVHVVTGELCRLALDRTGAHSARDSFLRVNQDIDATPDVSDEVRAMIRCTATTIMAAGLQKAGSSDARH